MHWPFLYEPEYMCSPRFFVYTDPRPLDFPLLDTYHPPAHQEELIRKLIQNGFHPLVDSLKQPLPEHVREMSGLVLLDQGQMLRCDQYTQGKILCIQWYHEPVSSSDLDIILQYCASFYGLGVARSYVTADEQRLIDTGYMTPTLPQPVLRAPTFLGNHVRVTPDEMSVLE